MKNKYQRLSKKEKKECRDMYYKTEKGKDMHIRLIRLAVIGITGIILSAFLLGNGIITKEIYWYDYVIIISLFLFSVVFIIGAYTIRKRVLNQFAIKIPKFKNK